MKRLQDRQADTIDLTIHLDYAGTDMLAVDVPCKQALPPLETDVIKLRRKLKTTWYGRKIAMLEETLKCDGVELLSVPKIGSYGMKELEFMITDCRYSLVLQRASCTSSFKIVNHS